MSNVPVPVVVRSFGTPVISDEGGLPASRMLGARNAGSDVLALMDTGVIHPQRSLKQFLAGLEPGGFAGLQFGLASGSDGPGHWGSALAWRHNHSREWAWFDVCAILMRREVLLSVRFDDDIRLGEDIGLRIRLEDGGYRLGVSRTTAVRHRFADTFEYARGQWLREEAEPARTMRKPTSRAGRVEDLPMLGELLRPAHKPTSVDGNASWLGAARAAPILTGFLFWAWASLVLLPAQIGLVAIGIRGLLVIIGRPRLQTAFPAPSSSTSPVLGMPPAQYHFPCWFRCCWRGASPRSVTGRPAPRGAPWNPPPLRPPSSSWHRLQQLLSTTG